MYIEKMSLDNVTYHYYYLAINNGLVKIGFTSFEIEEDGSVTLSVGDRISARLQCCGELSDLKDELNNLGISEDDKFDSFEDDLECKIIKIPE